MTSTEYVQNVDILSLAISQLEYVSFAENMEPKANIIYSFSPIFGEISLQQKSNDIIVLFPIVFSASSETKAEGVPEDEDASITVRIEYRIVFRSKKKTRIPKQAQKELLEKVVPRVLYPYFRQLVAEIFHQAGLPPLQLPLLENLEREEPAD